MKSGQHHPPLSPDYGWTWTQEDVHRETDAAYRTVFGWPDSSELREWFKARRGGRVAYMDWWHRHILPILDRRRRAAAENGEGEPQLLREMRFL